MKAIIGITGAESSGQTTMMRRLISSFGGIERFERWSFGTLRGMAHWDSSVVILGHYDNQDLTGSDKLPPSALADAIGFIKQARATPKTDGLVILWEGRRFVHDEFLRTCAEAAPLAVIWLETDPDERERRVKLRGKRTGRIKRIVPHNENKRVIERVLKTAVYLNNSIADQDAAIEAVLGLVERETLHS